jgi:type II secretion system (T2SS) protein G
MSRALLLMLAALAAACTPTNDPKLKEHVATAKSDMARVRASVEAFVQKNGRCPAAGEVERVADPWGRPYVVLCPGQKGHAADVVSKGADGEVGNSDDIRSWD